VPAARAIQNSKFKIQNWCPLRGQFKIQSSKFKIGWRHLIQNSKFKIQNWLAPAYSFAQRIRV
jgi:hypothetical protein